MSHAIHHRHAYHKRLTVAAPFSFNVTIDPLEGQNTDDGTFAIEIMLEVFIPGGATTSLWSIWRIMAHKRTGLLTLLQDSKRGPDGTLGNQLDMIGSSLYATPAARLMFAKVDEYTIAITVDPTAAPPNEAIGVAPDDFLDYGMWLDIRATRH